MIFGFVISLYSIFVISLLYWTGDLIQGQGHYGFWILGTKFLLVFLINYGSISYRLGAIDPQSFRYNDNDRNAWSDKGKAAYGVAPAVTKATPRV